MTLKDKEFLWHYGRSISVALLTAVDNIFPAGHFIFYIFCYRESYEHFVLRKQWKQRGIPQAKKIYFLICQHWIKPTIMLKLHWSWIPMSVISWITPREDVPPFGLKSSKRLISSHQHIKNRSQMLTHVKAIPVCITDVYKQNRVKVLNSRHT